MYSNLLTTMKTKGVTYTQIASLLGCRYQTVSENIQGNTEKGICVNEAMKIWKVFFPECNFMWLFCREQDDLNEYAGR
ncbi:DNA-binding protein [Lacrimispora sp.]|uniref:DNA-binding protein n=1 Tax=Lacrimispora sp. TaxID=2719234 RepID=UPI00289F3399|nr:DNA-binding protein [Lacrimispora sp.]